MSTQSINRVAGTQTISSITCSCSSADYTAWGSQRHIKEATDWVILDAEHFKANLVAPKGMQDLQNYLPDKIDNNIELLRRLDDDDDFFNISCHIEESLKAKIEHGDFIELEKLLPKDKSVQGHSMDDIQRLELVVCDGHPYFGTKQSEGKITNIHKWDQAFHVYTTIYVQVNPHCASKIMQYTHIIHTAAANYQWDSVAYYDFMFRHLMAAKPWRSWAKTYSKGGTWLSKEISITIRE